MSVTATTSKAVDQPAATPLAAEIARVYGTPAVVIDLDKVDAYVGIAGHCRIEDYVAFGGLCGVHQFVRIGEHAFVGAHSMIDSDVIPYGMAIGNRARLAGLNLVGLKRRVDTRNGKIVFFHVQPVVRDLLGVMKLDRFFSVADDEPRALASLRPLPTA